MRAVEPSKEPEFEVDRQGVERLVYDRAGWNYWTWQGHRIHWVAAGPKDAPPVVLVHGYGASAYHWRYQLPALAKSYRVYALCLLGFGYSTKALVDYTNANQWVAQISEFIETVVGGQPAALAGNSLGGYASLAAAAARPDLVRGVALLNGAGPLLDASQPLPDPDAPLTTYEQLSYFFTGLVKRVVLFFAFIQAKQPSRIRQVLEMVYVNHGQVDDELVDSIVQPATDPAAAAVFFRLNHGTRPPLTVNALLAQLRAPLLLLWGAQDPWCTVARARAVKALHPSAQYVGLNNAGHCPHDDTPEDVNTALTAWLATLPQSAPSLEAPTPSLTALAARLRAA